MEKWVALLLIVGGIALVIACLRRQVSAGFESGEFIAVIAGLIVGGGLASAGVIWMLTLLFIGI